ncbi:BCCT family transporter [Cyclobacterium xiamenense]|uniref:BCCT family transporter n=1 Tax=Cyclobacterium xiamenense TaxID=1297121 RepID=UPI0035D0D322
MSATLKLKPWVFFPPVVILVMTLAFGVTYSDPFLRLAERTKDGMLNQFGWLFSWSAFAFLILLGTAYVLPFGRTKIGGRLLFQS